MHSPPLGRKAAEMQRCRGLPGETPRTVLTETDLQGAAYIDV